MFQVPVRAVAAIRPSEHPGLLLGTAWSTAVLAVGPFLLPAIAAEYDVGLGLASLATALLLAGFVVGSFWAGRLFEARGRVLGAALAVAALGNALCAALPPFPVLLVLRVVVGVAAGVITWYSWAQVFGDTRRMSEIAVVGPLVGLTTAPVAAALIEGWGPEGVFVALAVTAMVPLAFSRGSGATAPATTGSERETRHRPSRDARAILIGLGLLTCGGSSVFTLGAVIAAENTSLSTDAIALAFSANAVASIPSARWTGRRGPAGAWLLACAACAVAMGTVGVSGVFVAAMAVWGFAFWMGTPAAYALLAARSRHPDERAGDAQAVMAAGRVVGPLVGGVLFDAAGPALLGGLGGSVMAVGALLLLRVDTREPTV